MKEVKARQVGDQGAEPHPGPTDPLLQLLPCYPSMLLFTPHVESCLLLYQLFPVDRRGASTVGTHMTMLSFPT